jgi:hypothetical protein
MHHAYRAKILGVRDGPVGARFVFARTDLVACARQSLVAYHGCRIHANLTLSGSGSIEPGWGLGKVTLLEAAGVLVPRGIMAPTVERSEPSLSA